MITYKKRTVVFLFVGMFLISAMSGFASATDLSVQASSLAEGITTGVSGFFGIIFSKGKVSIIFFAFLLGMIIFSVIKIMFKKSGKVIQWSITMAVTTLALIGLPPGFLESILINYGAMGATILIMIPFIIVLTFSIQSDLLIARVTWIFYSIYYLAMYLFNISNGWFTTENIPYMAGFIAGLAVFMGIKTIREFIFKGKIGAVEESGFNRAEKLKTGFKIEEKMIEAHTG